MDVQSGQCEWMSINNTNTSTEELISSIAGLSFEETRLLWGNGGYTHHDNAGNRPSSYGAVAWDLSSGNLSSHSIPMNRNRRDKINAGVDGNLNDGVLMSPGSKDMVVLGMQMADQVLSNSPGNSSK